MTRGQSTRGAEPVTSRRAAVEARRRQQRGGLLRIVALSLVALLLVGGAMALFFLPWKSSDRPAEAALSSAGPTDRPFTLKQGSQIILSEPSEETEAVHSATPRPTPTRSVGAPGVGAVGHATYTILDPAPGDSGREGRVIKYTVSVEDGVDFDQAQANNMVRATLTDPRGWEVEEKIHFVQVGEKDAAQATLKFIFASPASTDELCYPLNTLGEYTCAPKGTGRIVLNVRRWLLPVPAYTGQNDEFQSMLINHMVGYTLDKTEAKCPGAGQPAPIMQSQTLGMEGCKPNAWPSVA